MKSNTDSALPASLRREIDHKLFLLEDAPLLYNAVPHMSQPFHPQASLQEWVDDIRIYRGSREVAGGRKRMNQVATTGISAPVRVG